MPNRVGIEERPAIVDSKERIGDWEVDTIVGKDQKSALVVATERKTKLTLIRKIENFKAENTAQMVIAMLRKYKKWGHTITMDNGKEFYRHTLIETFAKKPFLQQPKPKHRFSTVSAPNCA